jgi:hypothetical protein
MNASTFLGNASLTFLSKRSFSVGGAGYRTCRIHVTFAKMQPIPIFSVSTNRRQTLGEAFICSTDVLFSDIN